MTNWVQLLNDYRDDIIVKYVETDFSMMDQSWDIRTALAMEPDGTLYTWNYVGTYSCPVEVWNGTDYLLHVFQAWDIEDVTGQLSDNDILDHCRGLVDQPWKALLQYKRSGECWSLFFQWHYPAVYESIRDIVMDNMCDLIVSGAEYCIDGHIDNEECRASFYQRECVA